MPAQIKGFWTCPQFVCAEDAPADLIEMFLRAAYRNGVSLYNTSYVNFSHKDADVAETLERLGRACEEL